MDSCKKCSCRLRLSFEIAVGLCDDCLTEADRQDEEVDIIESDDNEPD